MTSFMHQSLPAAFAALLLASFVAAQGGEADKPAKPDPEIQKKLKQFDEAVADKKFARDAEAGNLIDELLTAQPTMHEKDQVAFVKSLKGVFDQKDRKPDNPGLYRTTIFALGKIGTSDCAKILAGLTDKSPFEKQEWLALQEDILENVGRTKDPKQVEFLVKKATRGPEDPVMRAAGKALRFYEDLPLKQRREIFDSLVVAYGSVESRANASLDGSDADLATAKRTQAAIRDAWNGTLSALSGANFGTAAEWMRWSNKEGKDNKAWKK